MIIENIEIPKAQKKNAQWPSFMNSLDHPTNSVLTTSSQCGHKDPAEQKWEKSDGFLLGEKILLF